MNPSRSTWREPMVWMLVGLPLASVAIGFALLFAAVDHAGPASDSPDRVTHIGHLPVSAQVALPAATSKADAELILRHHDGVLEAVPTDPRIARGGDLTVVLTAQDGSAEVRTLRLRPSELGWRGKGDVGNGRGWRVVATSDRAPWRLSGQWPIDARFARLAL